MTALLLVPLAGCEKPPPSAYVHGAASTSAGQVAVGKNSVGEDCTQTVLGKTADIFCGTWQQPSARVLEGGPASSGQLQQLATASPWRSGLDTRFRCEAPVSTSILNGQPAQLMQCTRLVGGWAHVALVASINGTAWYADGVLPAVSVMERSIGTMAGIVKADSKPVSSAADGLLASRLAAQAFTSGDVGQFDQLMTAGTRANLSDNPGAAEAAFRAALALQRKALGHDNPNTATPLMSLALQLSNEGRYAESDAQFALAEKLVKGSAEPTAVARLAHYRGIDALNRGRLPEAIQSLNQADAAYAAQVPEEALKARPVAGAGNRFSRTGSFQDLATADALLTDPRAQSALLGLIEVRRNRAIALRLTGKPEQADAVLQSANDLARGNGLARPIVNARLYRTLGVTAAAQGDQAQALADLKRSTAAFDRALPGSKPLANTYLLRARQLVRAGEADDALPFCRSAVQSLATLKAGTTPVLMAACLDVYAAAAAKDKSQAQVLLDEMFTAAQLAQGSITSQQIAQASATLAENARDPKVAEAIRRQRDLKNKLDGLYTKRDSLTQAQQQGAVVTQASEQTAELDKQIAETRTQLADADAALQAASPNYGQLVQEVTPASDVFKALHPDEAFAALTLSDSEGWVFLLRNGTIEVSKIEGGTREVAELVRRVRAGIELGEHGLPPFDISDAQKLYKVTLGGVADGLKGVKSLVVAPSGPLLSLPFEVMLTGPADQAKLAEAPWLVRQFTLAHVPAASNFVSLRKIAFNSRANKLWFGFGDFRPVTLAQAEKSFPGATCADSAKLLSGLPLLPYARKELDAAASLLGAGPSDELLGPAFTADAVLKTHLKNYRVLQFSTHALLPTDLHCQTEPAIVTSAPEGAKDASGALLTASKVVRLDLDADLVILSACNSGGPGGSTAGESLSGLARAFFYAGARSLLVTHWSVNDQVAAYLVVDTLRRIKEHPNLGVTGALQASQLSLLAGAGKEFPPEIAHPFFWAPFAVIGEGGEEPATAQIASSGRKAGL